MLAASTYFRKGPESAVGLHLWNKQSFLGNTTRTGDGPGRVLLTVPAGSQVGGQVEQAGLGGQGGAAPVSVGPR